MEKKFEIKKSEPIKIIDLIEVEPKSVVTKSILKKTTVDMSVMAMDRGERLAEKVIPFDTVIHDIDGIVEVVIADDSNILDPGQAIIIPPHTKYSVKAVEPVKIIVTILKSGYEM